MTCTSRTSWPHPTSRLQTPSQCNPLHATSAGPQHRRDTDLWRSIGSRPNFGCSSSALERHCEEEPGDIHWNIQARSHQSRQELQRLRCTLVRVLIYLLTDSMITSSRIMYPRLRPDMLLPECPWIVWNFVWIRLRVPLLNVHWYASFFDNFEPLLIVWAGLPHRRQRFCHWAWLGRPQSNSAHLSLTPTEGREIIVWLLRSGVVLPG